MAEDVVARRKFLLGGVAGTAAAAGLGSARSAKTQVRDPTAASSTASPVSPKQETLLTLTAKEAAFVTAAVDALIPADDLSPSATDCGVVTFIDRQLASAWGGGSKMYRSGPFRKGEPEQGYQLPLSPREYFAAGIFAANDWSRKNYGADFDRLTAPDRLSALQAMEGGVAEFDDFSSRAFFEQLLAITMEGFFADPIYGGNRDKASWKMIGFPGLPANYANVLDQYFDKPYNALPKSIDDFS